MGQASHHPRLAVVVEDDAELRHLAAALLEETDLGVVECDSAEDALAVMRSRGDDVAMLFADVSLPGDMDGVDLARAVSKLWPGAKLVVTSRDPGDRLANLPDEACFMPKPWRALDVLVEAERAASGRALPVA
jgi:DNA-binding NtrC family response regulator